jgi:uncharacterized phage-associated protein
MRMTNDMLSAEEVVSVMKIIKDEFLGKTKTMQLLYYLQGVHLSIFDEPLFCDPIIHSDFSLLVESVQRSFDSIEKMDEEKIRGHDSKKIKFIQEMVLFFQNCTATFLVKKTQSEPPWINTLVGEEISLDALYDFFSENVEFNHIESQFISNPIIVDFSVLHDFLDHDNEDEDERNRMILELQQLLGR